jgi:hypothetical protein
MSLLDQHRAEALIKLACQRFDPEITDAEMQVLRDSASSVDLKVPEEGAPPPTIRPEFLRWLATDKDAAPLIDPKGLRVYGYTIPGNLDLEECKIPVTLDFRHCTIEGRTILLSAETRGIYLFDSSCKEGILASGANIRGPLFLKGSNFSGEITLRSAKITGQLNCGGAKLSVPEDTNALTADGAEIGGGVFLNKQFESTGEIRFLGAKITGTLDCGSAKLSVAEGTYALSADGAEIGGDVFLRWHFESTGTIRFLGAKITGDLDCSGAMLSVKEGTKALSADGAEIDGSVFLDKHFESTGTICFHGAKITGQLNFIQSKVAAVVAGNLHLSGVLFWTEMQVTDQTKLDLVGAKVKSILDDEGSWPNEGNLKLNGLVYEDIHPYEPQTSEEFTKARLEWLMRQPPPERLKPQPWMQLAKLLESRGDRKDAKHVIYKFRCMRAKSQKKWWAARRWAIFFAWLEETPIRITRTIALTVLIGFLIFGNAGLRGALAPTQHEPYEAFIAGKPMPYAYPVLNPLVYALENTLPLVKLGQDEKWAPDHRYKATDLLTDYWFLMWTRWILILAGWFQATVLVAAVADRFKK